MIDREWLDGLKVGDPVMIRWLKDSVPCVCPANVTRLLVREIEVNGHHWGRYANSKLYKFRKSDGRRWPLNAWSFELWRIEPSA